MSSTLQTTLLREYKAADRNPRIREVVKDIAELDQEIARLKALRNALINRNSG